MNKNWNSETIKIQSLSLWDENARFPDKYFNKSEQELIDYFLSKKDFKVSELAREIVGEIDIPQLEKIVVLRQDGKDIVVEGNRRLTAYKLLMNPTLTQNPILKTEFEQLARSVDINADFKLEALVTEDIVEAMRLVERKHLKTNNEISWGDSERAHYGSRKGQTDRQTLIKVALAKKTKETGLDESIVEKVLGKGFITTFQRIMAGSAAADVFGYEFDDKGALVTKDPEFIDKLKVVILNVLQKRGYDGVTDINSRSLNTTKQIKDYLKNIGKQEIAVTNTIIEESKSENLLGEKVIEISRSGKRSVPRSTGRKYLIPKSCILQIDGPPKINNIYHELKDNIILDDSKDASPNAAGVLFRVFLETSLDWFLEKHNMQVKKDDTISSKIPQVVGILKKVEGIPDSKLSNINKVGSSKPSVSILSIENFHQYVHSHKNQTQPTDLKCSWDDLQEFFEILWGSLHERHTAKTQKK